MALDGHIPSGPLAEKWDKHQFELKLVNPANKRKHTLIVVGTGLAGALAAATLAELGYNVLSFCLQDSPRRAHSIAQKLGARQCLPGGSAPPMMRIFFMLPAAKDIRQVSDLAVRRCRCPRIGA